MVQNGCITNFFNITVKEIVTGLFVHGRGMWLMCRQDVVTTNYVHILHLSSQRQATVQHMFTSCLTCSAALLVLTFQSVIIKQNIDSCACALCTWIHDITANQLVSNPRFPLFYWQNV